MSHKLKHFGFFHFLTLIFALSTLKIICCQFSLNRVIILIQILCYFSPMQIQSNNSKKKIIFIRFEQKFLETVSLCSPACPGSCSVGQAGLRDLRPSDSRVLELKVHALMINFIFILFLKNYV